MNGSMKTGFPSPGKIQMHSFPLWYKTYIPFSTYFPAWKLKTLLRKQTNPPHPYPVTAGLNKLTSFFFLSVWALLGSHRGATYVLWANIYFRYFGPLDTILWAWTLSQHAVEHNGEI